MRLYELFDKKYNWSWSKETGDHLKAEFETSSGDRVLVTFENIEGFWEISFKRGDSVKVTGEGDPYAIFATVKDILQEFIEKFEPESFSFSAEKSKVPNPRAKEMSQDDMVQHMLDTGETIPYHIDSESRIKLYRKFSQKIANKYGYKMTEHPFSDSTIFDFKKMSSKSSDEKVL